MATWSSSDTQYSGSGKAAGVGVEIPVGAGQKLGVSASGSAVRLEEAGRMFVLEAGEARDAYEDLIASIVRDIYKHGHRYVERVLNAPDAERFLEELRALDLRGRVIEAMLEEHATHHYYRSIGEARLNVGLSKGLGAAAVIVEGSAGTVLAVARETGDYSFSFEMDAEASSTIAAGVLGVGADVGSGGGVGATITLDYTADDQLIGASVTTSAAVSAGGSVGFRPGSVARAPSGTGGELGVSLSDAGVVETTYSLPLGDDPQAQRQLSAFLADPARNVGDFIEVAGVRGQVMSQGYQARETTEAVDVALRLLASAGYGHVGSHRQLTLVDAVSFDPVHGLMRRRDCLG